MVAAATDEEYDEAFAVFPVSIDPGSDDRYLNDKERKIRSIITVYCTSVYLTQLSTLIFTGHQLRKNSLQILLTIIVTEITF